MDFLEKYHMARKYIFSLYWKNEAQIKSNKQKPDHFMFSIFSKYSTIFMHEAKGFFLHQ